MRVYYYYASTFVVLMFIKQTSTTINIICNKVWFNSSRWNDDNIFYFNISNANESCTRYTFNAASDEIVQLEFLDFNIGNYSESCSEDHVKVGLHLFPYVLSNVDWTGSIGGTMKDIPRKVYSSSSILILEFYTKGINSSSVYLKGRYGFVKKDNYKMSGVLINNSKCDYNFNSVMTSTGKFYSLDYPSSSRENIKCRYWFHAKDGEIVNIIFHEIKLGKSDTSCIDTDNVIKIYEGKTLDRRKLTRTLCNEAKSVEYISSGSSVIVEINTVTEWPPIYFVGSYKFFKTMSAQARYHSQTPDMVHSIPILSIAGEMQCNESLRSAEGYGSITLLRNRSTYCRYEFEARGSSRIRISFANHSTSLAEKLKNNISCEDSNRLTALVWADDHLDNLANFCFQNTPKDVMSNGPRLVLTWDTTNSITQWNLTPQYTFLKNFGIASGIQLEGFECGFLYTAEDWPSGGQFTSPNYPGLYPRDTECHYFFQGMDWQRVKISFNDFDVQGEPPCKGSDYLEFSNCLTKDQHMPRKCGRSSFTMISDKKYFRVTFKSNSKLDATGFNATFQFFNDESFLMTSLNKSLNATVSHNMIWCMARTVFKLILLFFLLN